MSKPRVALYKFSSCSGCSQVLLNCEPQLVDIFGAIDLVYWVEAKSENLPGPYDLVIVDGGVSEPHEIELLKKMREQTKKVVAIGACASYGGPQALKNYANIEDYKEAAYPRPEWIKTLDWAGGIDMFIDVDYYVYGCGPSQDHLIEVIVSAIQGREAKNPRHSVCMECKRKGNVCILVAGGVNCMGPVTVAGCGAACPSRNRGCYSCFGPMPSANVDAFGRLLESLNHTDDQIIRTFRKMNNNAQLYKEVSNYYASRRAS